MPRIALAQTSPASAPSGPPALEKAHSTSPFPTLDQNLVDVVDFVERAAAEKAEVVVFPEYFLQGIVNEARQYLTFPSKYLLSFLCHLAKAHRVCLVGTIVHGSRNNGPAFPASDPFSHIPLKSGPRPSKVTLQQLEWAKYLEQHPLSSEENSTPIVKNTAFFIDEEGVLQGEYVKQNLWHPEREYIVAGIEPRQVFETKWGKAGLLICWDMSHPSAAQELADLGVDIIFAPTYWMATDSEPLIHNHPHPTDYETSVVSALCLTRAFETETVWIMCNAGGDAIEGFMGGSGVWAPLRGRVGGCGVEASLQIVDVETDVLKDARQTYKIREDWSKKQAT
ncbi:hypothetical protein CNBM0660 [Cryptococcus deneoformans B-3501A]|uniref:Expressed protein n=1 Tax=Cryptococcus deneoformans (strain JEC21 / ATCC MYA-565) TaxID=214684 RepID=Q5K7Z3_CRYD1|nr:expressed protein [Cryptococcus neoformans var. neoformans JEC21]XP_772146.1 hypothetical protein CNBM0660 [Cryptococcus neoformans var. neoformans B-3501A]AAW46909.1 expressed protein [Cryptococcus neoformans var. neoformans JEC21]EAL17499.1 hypothetical protein CNBM0660 [Cryptococcus neoformans var. neoformans B-3501A]